MSDYKLDSRGNRIVPRKEFMTLQEVSLELGLRVWTDIFKVLRKTGFKIERVAGLPSNEHPNAAMLTIRGIFKADFDKLKAEYEKYKSGEYFTSNLRPSNSERVRVVKTEIRQRDDQRGKTITQIQARYEERDAALQRRWDQYDQERHTAVEQYLQSYDEHKRKKVGPTSEFIGTFRQRYIDTETEHLRAFWKIEDHQEDAENADSMDKHTLTRLSNASVESTIRETMRYRKEIHHLNEYRAKGLQEVRAIDQDEAIPSLPIVLTELRLQFETDCDQIMKDHVL